MLFRSQRVQKLAALLRLALLLLRISGFTLAGERLPNGLDKLRILRAIDQARACIPLQALLRFLRLSPSRFHALATTAYRMCTRRSVVLSAHVAASTNTIGDPRDARHGDVARLPACSYRNARGARSAARQGMGVRRDLVPPRKEIRLATASPPRASRKTQDRTSNLNGA